MLVKARVFSSPDKATFTITKGFRVRLVLPLLHSRKTVSIYT